MRLRKFLRKVHRWIGVFASLWLLLLATTGYLLQHKEDWSLDNKYVQSRLLLSIYDIGDQFVSHQLPEGPIISQLDYQVYIYNQPVMKLSNPLVGAIELNDQVIIATRDELHWFNKENDLIQSFDSLDGLPSEIDRIGISNQQLILQAKGQALDLNGELWTDSSIQWSEANDSKKIKTAVLATATQNYLSWEQFLFDLHAGLTTPSLLNDFAALALIFLCLSGLIIFFKKSYKKTLYK